MAKSQPGSQLDADKLTFDRGPGAPPSASLPLGVKLAYGFPTFPGLAMALPIGVFMTKFYADAIGVSLGFIALAQVLARSIDAVTDPLMGWLTDGTRTRWGRRRPWMLIGAPLTAVAQVALFGPPAGMDPLGGAVWFTLAFINAGLAQAKNRSGLNWFLVSVILGPIATFLLVAAFEKL